MPTIINGGTIITMNKQREVLYNTSLLIDNGRIKSIFKNERKRDADVSETINGSNLVVVPGFVQTHVHMCQTLFRGLADDLELLDWLRDKIFPMESAHNENSMYLSANLGIAELIRSGTTTILDMGSVNHEEEIIRAISETGLRAFVGKAMMDVNDLYPKLKESTSESLRSTRKLAEQWHNSFDGRVKYAVAPRYVLSCTDKLMRDAYEMANGFTGILFHTHASENKAEIKKVRERCKMENIEFLHHLGVLSERSCLAHCVHLVENEINILKSTKANISHCPSSNLKLGSGIPDVPHLVESNINISLGADGAPCNNNLNMFQEMRLASLIQKPKYGPTAMPAQTVFEMATINGAKALGLDTEIGSIEVGKKADIVLLNLKQIQNPVLTPENIYSSIVYSAGQENVDSVMIDGRWVYKNGQFVNIDREKLTHEAANELKLLLERID